MSGSIISICLSVIFNNCNSSGVQPDVLKIPQITLIYQTGLYGKCSNYRSLSLLSPINKVFKKLLYHRLYSYLKHNNLLTDC